MRRRLSVLLSRLSVLFPTILVCCVIIIVHGAITTSYLPLPLNPTFIAGAVAVLLAGALAGPLTLLYSVYDKAHLIVAALILTALLLAMILAHPIKPSRWTAIITIIGVCIWMGTGYLAMWEMLARMGP